MGVFGFVNWRVVNERFCMLIWLIAAILAIVVLVHLLPAGHAPPAMPGASHIAAPAVPAS